MTRGAVKMFQDVRLKRTRLCEGLDGGELISCEDKKERGRISL